MSTLDRWRLASAVGMCFGCAVSILTPRDRVAFWMMMLACVFYLGLRIGARAATGRWE